MLIFDSGIGGFSILKYIKRILPNMHYIYVLDNEMFPYGNKTKLFILQRSISIINTVQKTYSINVVFIACNTASTTSLSILRRIFTFPIIGILPDIQEAIKITKNNIIGLIATNTTINSDYTQKIIKNLPYNIIIQTISTNKLAIIAENKIRKKPLKQYELENILKPWTNLTIQPDTILLGCTHFVFLKKEIQKILYQSIYFVDSTKTMINKIKKYFCQININQQIKTNILLYSKNNREMQELLYCIDTYNFDFTKEIRLQ